MEQLRKIHHSAFGYRGQLGAVTAVYCLQHQNDMYIFGITAAVGPPLELVCSIQYNTSRM